MCYVFNFSKQSRRYRGKEHENARPDTVAVFGVWNQRICWLRFRDREGPRCQLQYILRGRVRVAVDFDTWERLSGSSKKQTDAPPRQSRQER